MNWIKKSCDLKFLSAVCPRAARLLSRVVRQGPGGVSCHEAGLWLWEGKVGVVEYSLQLNKTQRWDSSCYSPSNTVAACSSSNISLPRLSEEQQTCYWRFWLRYGHRIRLRFLAFHLEEDPGCLADYPEIYDSYDDVAGFAGRWLVSYLHH
ncbi:tumor necrosis factor-inducible gene 6 protein [Arapaima gigas]